MKYKIMLVFFIGLIALQSAEAYIIYGGSRSVTDDFGNGTEIDFALWPQVVTYFEQFDFVKKIEVTPFNMLTGVTTIYWESWVEPSDIQELNFELNMFARHYYNIMASDMWSPALPLYESFYYLPNGQTSICYPHYVSWMGFFVLRCDPL